MYCSQCGSEMGSSARFCSQCGQRREVSSSAAQEVRLSGRLTRNMSAKKIAGVCAGIARYLNMDVTLVRVLMVLFAFYPPGIGLLFYLACWIVIPRDLYFPYQPNLGSARTARAGN